MKHAILGIYFILSLAGTAHPFELETGRYERQGARYIRVTGIIMAGDAQLLRTILKAEPDPAVVVFNSRGGSVTEAMEMGRDIRRYGASTYVGKGQLCVSACILAFMGGTRRAVAKEGELGSHQFYWPDGTAPSGREATVISQRLSASVLRHFIALEVDPEALTLIMDTAPAEMLIFTPELQERFRLVGTATSLSNPLAVIPEGTYRAGCPFPETYLNSDPLNLYPACRG